MGLLALLKFQRTCRISNQIVAKMSTPLLELFRECEKFKTVDCGRSIVSLFYF